MVSSSYWDFAEILQNEMNVIVVLCMALLELQDRRKEPVSHTHTNSYYHCSSVVIKYVVAKVGVITENQKQLLLIHFGSYKYK